MSEAAATSAPSPQDRIMGHLMGVVHGRAIACAAELGIADALADGPLAIDEIANRTGVQSGNLFRLLRALESIGVFRETSPGVYENNSLSDCLCQGSAGSLWPLVRMWAPGWGYWDRLAEMADTIRADKTTLFDRWGYDDVGALPPQARSVGRLQRSYAVHERPRYARGDLVLRLGRVSDHRRYHRGGISSTHTLRSEVSSPISPRWSRRRSRMLAYRRSRVTSSNTSPSRRMLTF